MSDSLTQGDQEGGAPQGASPTGTRELCIKWRDDGSTSRSPAQDRAAAETLDNIPTYPSSEAARQDRDFKGGWFWVGPRPAYFTTGKVYPAPPLSSDGVFVMSGPRQIGRWITNWAAQAQIVGGRDKLADILSAAQASQPTESPKDTNPPAERVKDSNPKTVYGEAKPSLSLIPGPALVEVAQAMREGKAKYGSMNWREDPVSSTTYADAALRHLFQWLDGEDRCPKSGALHLAHLAANAMILIDAALQETLIDDRPPAGTTSAAIDRNTRPIKGATDPQPWVELTKALGDLRRSTPHVG